MTEISKKELLTKTGISYGQLYRWKRERLIPEEWFVKRSAITGQETYFPREQILDRVEAIIDLKEDHSLEEIRSILASEHSSLLGRKRIEALEILPKDLFDKVPYLQDKKEFRRGEIGFMLMVTDVAKEHNLPDDDYYDLLNRSLPLFDQDRPANSVVLIFNIDERLFVATMREGSKLLFDFGVEVVRTASLADLVAKLKIRRFDNDDTDTAAESEQSADKESHPKIVNINPR